LFLLLQCAGRIVAIVAASSLRACIAAYSTAYRAAYQGSHNDWPSGICSCSVRHTYLLKLVGL
jgi:hypothetical protein